MICTRRAVSSGIGQQLKIAPLQSPLFHFTTVRFTLGLQPAELLLEKL
jgi:hypothetical protein